jgi:cytochrome bd-type quinol oxidase subunit 1
MSSLDKRRDDVARTQNACADLFLFSEKAQIEKEIQTLLRDKTVDMIKSSVQLSLLRRVVVLLSTLIVKKIMNAKLRKMNKRFKSIEQNINKTTTTIELYVTTTKTNNRLEKNSTTIEFAKFINLNQQKQLNELKKSKTFIYKIKKKTKKQTSKRYSLKN